MRFITKTFMDWLSFQEIDRVMSLVKQRDATLSPAINRTWTDAWGRAEVISIYRIEPL